MINYLDFYKSAKEYLIKIGKVSEQDFEPVEEFDIVEVENLIGKKMPISLRSFQFFFGKTTKQIPEGLAINLSSLKDAYFKSKNKLSILESKGFNVHTDGKKKINGKVVQIDDTVYGVNLEVVNMLELLNIDDFFFLSIKENTTFISSKEDDPIIHFFIGTSTLTSSMNCLSTYLRVLLFNQILPKLGWNPNNYKDKNGRLKKDLSSFDREYFWKVSSIDISNLEWALIYEKIFREGWEYENLFKEIRREFYQVNEMNEKQNGYVLTVDEFEWKFIEFLKSYGFNI